jgi:hypothetical protein
MTTYCGTFDVHTFAQVDWEQVGFASLAAYNAWIAGTLIPKAQDVIDNYCRHNFYENGGTIVVDGSGKEGQPIFRHALTCYSTQKDSDTTGTVRPSRLLPLPLISVTAVEIDGTEVTLTDIQTYSSYLSYDDNFFNEGRQNITIKGTWGYGTYPHDIQYVTAQLCANMLTEMVRRRLLPDLVTPILERGDASTRAMAMLFRSPQVLTNNEKEILHRYMYHEIEVG